MKALVIGDPHFKHNSDVSESEEYVTKIIAIARKHDPTFIVILGDILDTHEIIRVQPHNLAEKLIEGLSEIAHTYVLIGNHDYINNSQFLTTNHIFGPFKKWNNVTIVDAVVGIYIEEKYFVFVPYVPVGRFQEALDTLVKDGETWELADCIFAHQEFKGCKPRNKDNTFKSKVGDIWDEDYPLVISGHIHKAQNVGKNIKYPGNSLQHSYLENPNKHVLIVEWGEDIDDEIAEPTFTKISTGMKKKKSIDMNVTEIKEKGLEFFEEDGSANYNLQINLVGTTAEFNNFKTSELYNNLTTQGTVFSYEIAATHKPKNNDIVLSGATRSEVSYDRVFQNLVFTKNELIKKQYEKLFGVLEPEEKEYIEINYVSVSSNESVSESSAERCETSLSTDENNGIVINTVYECKVCKCETDDECHNTMFCVSCDEVYCNKCSIDYLCKNCDKCSICEKGKLIKYKGVCGNCKKGNKK
jgi:DNA repair exonuclease SbcCD nuclease subunit